MDLKKLAPWNWFKKEEEEGGSIPIRHEAGAGTDLVGTHPMGQLHREIDRLFDHAFRSLGVTPQWPEWPRFAGTLQGMLKPTLDLGVTDAEYTVTVEIPGVAEKDVHLELTGDTLVIRGEKKQEREDRDKNYYRMERSYGAFQRLLSLPEDVDQERIAARFKNGVMTVTMPRKAVPESAVRRIAVKSGD